MTSVVSFCILSSSSFVIAVFVLEDDVCEAYSLKVDDVFLDVVLFVPALFAVFLLRKYSPPIIATMRTTITLANTTRIFACFLFSMSQVV